METAEIKVMNIEQSSIRNGSVPGDMPVEIHVVSHTHWDREWRYPLQTTKTKLLDCMDHVIKILARDPDYRHFMCDGQMIMVDDYLDWRPEMRSAIERLCREGRLVLGPWYSLIDEYLVSGESVVRNLLKGYRAAEATGGVQKIGYAPASFGHISQLPQILAGFGFDTALFSRGLSSDVMPDMEYIWEGADGTRVLASHMVEDSTKSNFTKWVHLPTVTQSDMNKEPSIAQLNGIPFFVCDQAYAPRCVFYALNPKYVVDVEAGYKAVLKLKEHMLTRCTVPVLLFLDGVDQMEANPYLTEILREVGGKLAKTTGDRLVHSTLTGYFNAVRKATAGKTLRTLRGEMQYPNKFFGGCSFFGAVNMARLYQHIRNEQCENLVHRWAEPLASLAAMEGAPYPVAPLNAAWRYLFENHTHDCIAGCAVDAVHDNVMHRYDQVDQIAGDVMERSLQQLSLRVDLSDFEKHELALIAYNPLPFARTETVTCQLDFPNSEWVEDFTLWDGDREIPYQTTTRHTEYRLMVKHLDFAQGIPLQRFEVSFRAEDVSPLGYKTFRVKYRIGAASGGHKYKDKLTRKYAGSLAPGRNALENEHLRLTFNPNGTFDLTHKANGRVFKGQHYFEDAAMIGDIWSPITPGHDLGIVNTLTASPRLQLVQDGPAVATMRVEYGLQLPTHVDKEKQMPAATCRPFRIVSDITLCQGAQRVDIVTQFENNVEDHMLRVMFPTDLKAEAAQAEGAFDVLTRTIVPPHTPDHFEPPMINYTNRGWCDVTDGQVGLALLNEGLTAYQVLDDERRTASMVLVRAVDSPGIIAMVQKGAQCLRPHVCRYAVYPHVGDWEAGGVFKQARAHNVGMRLIYTMRHEGALPQKLSFIRFEPDTLVLSGLKQSEDGKAFILRFFNPSERAVAGQVKFYRPPRSAALVDLKEDVVQALKSDAGAVALVAGPKKIVTLRIEV